MCNNYRLKITAHDLKEAAGPYIDLTNATSFDESFYPNTPAPVVRNNIDGPELAICHWGMPTPEIYQKGKVDMGITNIRNTASQYWKRWLSVEHRCLVPATAFSEFNQTPDEETGKKPLVWYSKADSDPLFFMAGIWTEWTGIRKKNTEASNHSLFAFLTCEPNDIVAPVHPKAMPVILTEPDELDMWMNAEWEIAKELQRPVSNGKISRIN